MKIYLSSPVSAYQQVWNNKIAALLRNSGHTVYLPQEITPNVAIHEQFEIEVYQECVHMIMDSDLGLLAVPYGRDCAWEVGFYAGLHKPMILYLEQINFEKMNFLRDWMVKGSLNFILTSKEDVYQELLNDNILKKSNVGLIKDISELPVFITRYLTYLNPFTEPVKTGVGAIVTKSNEVLMVREKEDSHDYLRRDGMWGFPTKTLPNTDPRKFSEVALNQETGLVGTNPRFISKQQIPGAVGLFYALDIDNADLQMNSQWVKIEDVITEKLYLRPTYKEVMLDYLIRGK